MQAVYFQHIAAIVAGIMVLALPHLLNYVVGIYLVLFGAIGLVPRR